MSRYGRKTVDLDSIGTEWVETLRRETNLIRPLSNNGIEMFDEVDEMRRGPDGTLELRTRYVPAHTIWISPPLEPGDPARDQLIRTIRDCTAVLLGQYGYPEIEAKGDS